MPVSAERTITLKPIAYECVSNIEVARANLLIRARAHDHVRVDLEKNEIYLFDHDYPGDVHPACIEEYSKR